MYPSTFYQPFYHQSRGFDGCDRRSQPTFVVSSERPCHTSIPFIDYQYAVEQRHRQRQRAAQAAALQREQERQRHLAIERERAVQREQRRHIVAQREYERRLERQRQEQAAARAYYLAERDARLDAQRRAQIAEARRRERQEEVSFAQLLDSLFHDASQALHVEPQPSRSHAEPESDQVEAFSESESEETDDEDEGVAMDTLLNTLFDSFGLQRDDSPSVEVPQSTTEERPTHAEDGSLEKAAPHPIAPETLDAAVDVAQQDAVDTLDDIHQRYTEHLARVERLEALDSLDNKLANLTSAFTFPSHLDFQDHDATSSPVSESSTPSVPPLTYASTNVPYHAHAQSLLGLLVEADAVESDGDEQVRARRKEFVRRVEAELDALEGRKSRFWAERKAGC